MDTIKVIGVEELTYEEVTQQFQSVRHLRLNEAERGCQPDNTFILGELTEFKKKVSRKNYESVLKFSCVEAAVEDSPLFFKVVLYGEFADCVDQLLCEDLKHSTVWVAFTGSMLRFPPETDSNGEPLVIHVNNKQASCPEISLFHQPSIVKMIRSHDYSMLCDVKANHRYKLFVIVEMVVKRMTALSNGNRHMVVGIIDPSCSSNNVNSCRLLHVFFNNKEDNFLEDFEAGDILRISSLLGNLYGKEERTDGKIYSSNAIVHFKSREDDDKVTPITNNLKYTLSRQDERIVRSLRNWYTSMEAKLNVQNSQNNPDDPDQLALLNKPTKKIEEILEPSVFNMVCEVVNVKRSKSLDLVAARMRDGTKFKGYTSQADLQNLTQHFESDNIVAVKNPDFIDILFMEDLLFQAVELKKKDIVHLLNVKASYSMVRDGLMEGMDCPLEFSMKESNCFVRKLDSNNFRALKLKKQIDEMELAKINGNSNSEIAETVAGNSQDEITRLVEQLNEQGPSSKRLESTPVSANKQGTPRAPISPKKQSTSRSSASTKKEITSISSASAEKQITSSTPISRKKQSTSISHASTKKGITSSRSLTSTNEKSTSSSHVSPRKRSTSRSSSSSKKGITSISSASAEKQSTSSTHVSANKQVTSSTPDSPKKQSTSKTSTINQETTPKRCQKQVGTKSKKARTGDLSSCLYSALNEDIDISANSGCDGDRVSAEESLFSRRHSVENNNLAVAVLPNNRATTNCSHVRAFYIECGCYPEIPLSRYMKYRGSEERVVNAFINGMNTIVEGDVVCNCFSDMCFHQWIWGMCQKCGCSMDSATLSCSYPKEKLKMSEKLDCFKCLVQASVVPYIRVEFSLQDPDKQELNVALIGDNAVEFFGVEPAFKWIVDNPPNRLIEICAFFERASGRARFSFCLKKVPSKNAEGICCFICESVVRGYDEI